MQLKPYTLRWKKQKNGATITEPLEIRALSISVKAEEMRGNRQKVSSHPFFCRFCCCCVCVCFRLENQKNTLRVLNIIKRPETTRNEEEKKIVNMKLAIVWNRHAAVVNLQTVNTSLWFVCRMLSWKDFSLRILIVCFTPPACMGTITELEYVSKSFWNIHKRTS